MVFQPDVINFLLTNIYKVAQEIQLVAKRVQANRYQCAYLSERIDTVVGFLHPENFFTSPNVKLNAALERFYGFLQQCLHFINKFASPGWLQRISRNGNYAERFRQLHHELNKYSQELNFGLSTTQYSFNFAENDIIAQNDQEEIDEILSSIDSQRRHISRRMDSNLKVRMSTNISAMAIPRAYSKYHSHVSKHRYNNHHIWYGSMQPAKQVFYPMNGISKHHGPIMPNRWYM